ncbi:MAG TPA: T9SS type A sorting domain-containing protein [Pedobacter sp.]|jgi:hypothetical protein
MKPTERYLHKAFGIAKDLSGRIVYKTDFISNGVSEVLNTGTLQTGVYVIRITGASTKFSSKVIVE